MNWTTIWAAGATIVAALTGYNSFVANQNLTEIQQSLSSFDAVLDGDDLVLILDGSVFTEPQFISITPISNTPNGTPFTGKTIQLVIDSGKKDREKGTITYTKVVDRICGLQDKPTICQNHPPSTLMVHLVVNGIKDIDDVSIPSS